MKHFSQSTQYPVQLISDNYNFSLRNIVRSIGFYWGCCSLTCSESSCCTFCHAYPSFWLDNVLTGNVTFVPMQRNATWTPDSGNKKNTVHKKFKRLVRVSHFLGSYFTRWEKCLRGRLPWRQNVFCCCWPVTFPDIILRACRRDAVSGNRKPAMI